MYNNFLKTILAAGVLTVFSLGFSGCNSENKGQDNNDANKEAMSTMDSTANHKDMQGMDQMEGMVGGKNNTATAEGEQAKYASVDEAFKKQMASVYQQYLKVKDGLVNSKAEDTQKAAQGVLDAISKVDASKLSAEQKAFYDQHMDMVKQHAQAIADAESVEKQREQLDMFSSSMFALLKAFGTNDQTAYYQYCPMVKASWISQTSQVRNPYMGQKMLTCGQTKETLSAK